MRTFKALFPVVLVTAFIAMVLVMGSQIQGETDLDFDEE